MLCRVTDRRRFFIAEAWVQPPHIPTDGYAIQWVGFLIVLPVFLPITPPKPDTCVSAASSGLCDRRDPLARYHNLSS
jgi:hypothetical protein